MRADPNWDRLRIVGEGLENYKDPFKTYIEMRGGLLAVHSAGTGWISSIYSPARHVTKSTRKRRYGSYLIRAVGVPLIGLLAFLILLGLTLLFSPDRAEDGSAGDLFLTISALIFSVVFGAYFLFNVVRFFIPIPTTMLFIDPVEDKGSRWEFWHAQGESPRLDAILEGLRSEREEIEVNEREPVTIAHDWGYVYPLKNAAYVTVAAYVFGYFISMEGQSIMQQYGLGGVGLLLFLTVPLLIGAVYYIQASYRLSANGKIYKTAIEQFVAGNCRRIKETLRAILEENPEDEEALLLLTHANIQMNDFDGAKRTADFFGSLNPERRQAMILDIELIRSWYHEKSMD